MSSKAAI